MGIIVLFGKDAVCFDDLAVKCRNIVVKYCEIAVNILVTLGSLSNGLQQVCGVMQTYVC